MPVSATRTTTFKPLTGDQDADGFVDFGDVLRHTLVITNTGTAATSVVVNDPLNGSTLTGSVNVSPIAFADAFTAVGNTLLEVGNATAQTGPQSSVAGSVISNDVEFLGDSFTISAFDATSANGGTISMVTSGLDAGSFTYISNDGFTGTDTFTYTIRDDGLDGVAGNSDDLTSVGTVTITVANQVWYVDSAAAPGGDGTSTNPFQTVTLAGAASGANDYVHVAGTAGGSITLDAGEQLYGTGTTLTVGGFQLTTGGTNSSVNLAGAGFTVTLGTGNTITGVDILNTGGGALTGSAFGTLTVSDVALDASGQALSLTTGAISGAGFNSTDSDGGTNNVSLTTVTGSLNLGGGALSGATGTAVVINGGNGSFDYNGTVTHTGNAVAIQVLNKTGGTVDFDGAVASNTASDGVSLTTNTGATINFDGGLVVNTSSSGTAGFTATGGGTVSVTGGSNSITSGAGTALNLSGVIVGATGLTLNSISTTGANGVLLSSVTQAGGSTGIDINGGSIVNASTRGVDIDASSADVSIAATISTTAAGRSVEVTGSGGTGGRTIVFSGAIDENGLGINLDNNDQLGGIATINFTGGLDIDSTTSTGFNAINGGTINVTGTNTINNTTGVAINVANTTIGTSGLTFQTIANSGAANGIVLNSTGTGAFTVTGTGSAGTGGTISGATGTAGVSLTSTGPVTLGWMTIQTSAGDGVLATTVAGFRLDNSSVLNNGNAVTERGVELNNVTGTVTFLNTSFVGNAEDNLYIRNTSGTINLTVDDSDFSAVSTTVGNDGIILIAAGTSTFVASITDSTFDNHRGDHFQATNEADAASTTHLTFTGNTLTGDRGTTYGGNDLGGGITINPGALTATSNVTFNISNNNIQGATSSAITINKSGDTGTLQGTIANNTIGTAGTADSGSSQGDGINVSNNDNGTITVLINNNSIRQYSNLAGINVFNRDGSGRVNATITNNTISNPGTFAANGLLVTSGSASGDAGDTYLDIENNTTAGSGFGGATDIRVRQRFDTDVFLEGYGGGQWDAAAVATYLTGRNTGAETASATVQNGSPDPNGFFTTGVGTIPQPNAPTLPPAPLFVDLPPLPPAPDGDGAAPSGPQPDLDTAGPGESGPVVVDDGLISQAELNLIIAAAIERWAEAGATAEQIAAMQAVTVSVGDLGGLQVGASSPGTIQVDDNAGGWSWFIDATPGDDAEYVGTGTRLTAADPSSQAGTRVDLLTALTHELGHQIGLYDSYLASDADQLMFGMISAGERRLPGADDVATGGGEAVAGALALVPINLGTIPAGQTVTIMWDSTLDVFGAGLVPTYTNFSTISGNNPGAFSVNSNTETLSSSSLLALDSLTLGGTVWNDNGAGGGTATNGSQDGTEAGVNGVSVTLFIDNGASAGVWDGTDTLVTTVLTVGGFYSFTGLAPGDYIVRVDLDNFDAGGNVSLLNLQSSSQTIPEPSDPDNNVDNDDNGSRTAGAAAYSNAITLAFDTEPTAGPGNDTNTTLDFGFHSAAPTVTAADTTVSGTEDTNLVFNAGNSNLITVADVDSASLTVTLTVTSGLLTLSQTTGLAFTTGDGSADLTMSFSGTIADVNAALNGLIYRGNLNYEGADTLNVQVSDGLLSDSEAIAITLADDGTIDGTSGNDTLTGTPASDLFDLSQGGDDTATGLGSDDGFYMGAALSQLDNLDGGAGTNDQVALQGNYGSPFVLGANNLTNIETLALLPGNDTRFGDLSGAFYDYSLATVDANVAAGQILTVNFNTLRAGEDVTFNGSAETDGSFLTYGGLGTDTITGGAQSDGFYFGNNGRWGAGDAVTGGAGADDQLGLQGSYTVTFGAGQLTGIETLALLTGGDARFGNPPGVGYSYAVTMNNGNVGAGQTLVVNANSLRANQPGVTDETLTFNGAAELDGKFTVYGGAAADVITGGAGADLIYGGGGADTLTGGTGNDTFAYMNTAHSTPTVRDTISDFTTGDVIDLAAIDANTIAGGDQAFSFISSAAFAGTGAASAGELRFESSGPNWLIQGDTDGNGVADFEILVTLGDASPIASTDFVL